MMLRNRAWMVLAALAILGCAPQSRAGPTEDTDYRLVTPAQHTQNPDKIEVVEFFSYACPHCAAFYPLINAWAAKLPPDVVLRRVPVSFNRPPWVNLERAYFALDSSGDLKRLDGALFNAIHQEHLPLFDAQSLAEWVGKNGGHADKFSEAYTSFSVNSQTVMADKMAEDDYKIESIPSLAVDGKYVAIADPKLTQEQYFSELLQHTDELIAKVRAERPKAAAKPAKSTSN
jgi:thiol:disulfide interchange protein DsbA